jgi:hypothetical protein
MKKPVRYGAVLLTAMVGGAPAALAQGRTMEFTVASDAQPARPSLHMSAFETRITTGRPYSAEAITEVTQVLGDGNRIGRKETARIYRDSDGRTRREQLAHDGTVRLVSIYDPVAHVTYVLDPATKTAHKSAVRVVVPDKFIAIDDDKRQIEEKLAANRHEPGVAVSGRIALVAPAELPAPAPAGADVRKRTAEMVVHGPGALQPGAKGAEEMNEEALGQMVVEGLLADGKRVTTTLPAGTIGNEQPITIQSEQWFSPDLEVLVMTRHSDPRWGHTTYTLSNVVRGEPQAGLFDLPADYTIMGSRYMRAPAQR